MQSHAPFRSIADQLQMCLHHFCETYDPTIEDSYRKQVVIDQQSCMLEIVDTAGQEEYTTLRDQWIRDGEGFVLVYSIDSRASFSRIQKFHSLIQRTKESAANGSPTYTRAPIYLGPSPVMLVGNKSDKVTEREVSTQEGSALAKRLGCQFVEASAKNCVNVETIFYDVVRHLRKQRIQAIKTDRRGQQPNGTSRSSRREDDNRREKRDRSKHSPRCVIL